MVKFYNGGKLPMESCRHLSKSLGGLIYGKGGLN